MQPNNGTSLKDAFEALLPDCFNDAPLWSCWSTFTGLDLLFADYDRYQPNEQFIRYARELRTAFIKFIPHRIEIAVVLWRLIQAVAERAGVSEKELHVPDGWQEHWRELYGAKSDKLKCAFPNTDKCECASDVHLWCRLGCALPEDLCCYFKNVQRHYPELVRTTMQAPHWPCHFTPPPGALMSVAIEGPVGKAKAERVRLTDAEMKRISDRGAEEAVESDTRLVKAMIELRVAILEAKDGFDDMNFWEKELDRLSKQLAPLRDMFVERVKKE
jgi:hypothetical protein